uniref:Uncharacterized protein n=1 Tax=Lepeophtheirus salmonis TaxID=72036 RepID=A0A0K2UN23_LEPSM
MNSKLYTNSINSKMSQKLDEVEDVFQLDEVEDVSNLDEVEDVSELEFCSQ